MSRPRNFMCAECGGDVRMLAKPGRTFEDEPGIVVAVPADFEIPTCKACGTEYFNPELLRQLNKAVSKQKYAVQAAHVCALVQRLQDEHGVTSKDVGRACHVTPSYLSGVLGGRRLAGVTLVRLLEAFCACPSEFLRHLRGEPWSSLKTIAKAVRRRVNYAKEGNLLRVEQWNPTDQGANAPVRKGNDGVAA